MTFFVKHKQISSYSSIDSFLDLECPEFDPFRVCYLIFPTHRKGSMVGSLRIAVPRRIKASPHDDELGSVWLLGFVKYS